MPCACGIIPAVKESIGQPLGIVFSTGQGRMCPACARPVAECVCAQGDSGPLGDGNVRVSRQTKGRRGKAVTVIEGLPLDAKGLHRLARQLKRTCGAGGTVKEGTIEIQGDHRDELVRQLQAQGYKAKPAGG